MQSQTIASSGHDTVNHVPPTAVGNSLPTLRQSLIVLI